MLAGIEPLGFTVTQMYGLTETYGHVVECIWQDDWAALPEAERFERKARTGVAQVMEEHVTVMNPETMEEVPADAETIAAQLPADGHAKVLGVDTAGAVVLRR